jgi:hypothetical protein
MNLRLPSRPWPWIAPLVAGLALGLLAPHAAQAQTTMDAEAGLDRFYKPQHWMPVQVTLTNQGPPTRVEVRTRFQQGMETPQEYRIPERALRSGAFERHTLYMKAPAGYVAQNIGLELFREGRSGAPVRPQVNRVNEGDWLVVAIGSDQLGAAMKQLRAATLGPQETAPDLQPWMGRANARPQVNVAVVPPDKVPDRWQGLEAADLVVLGDVSERDLTPDRAAALRDYVMAGGRLVITGGINAPRLSTPFFQELLPVTVTGTRTVSSFEGLRAYAQNAPPARATTIGASTPRPGARVLASQNGTPLAAEWIRGAGTVVYLAFDPAAPPFRGWDQANSLWRQLMLGGRHQTLVQSISRSDSNENPYGGYGQSGQNRMAEAPFAISQLAIPEFYIVALFLLAYILVLVPGNYYFLKARDKKEYAWLTTPLIVLLFSFGAYMIGYTFKGGRTLLAKVAVVEAHAGQTAAPEVAYAGIFSPRKTGYDIQMAATDPASQAEAQATLLSEPNSDRPGEGVRILQDDTQKIDDFAVDMWAMRVFKAEGVMRLGKGFGVSRPAGGLGSSLVVRNDSPYSLDDCQLVSGGTSRPVGGLPAGGSLTLSGIKPNTPTASLPPSLLKQTHGTREEQRMKEALLLPLCQNGYSMQPVIGSPHPILVGWIKEPVARVTIDGNAPREQAVTLMVLHLD